MATISKTTLPLLNCCRQHTCFQTEWQAALRIAVPRKPSRPCRGPNWKWNGLAHQTLVYTPDVGSWEDLHSAVDYDINDMYKMEVRYFLDCVRKRRQPITDGNEGHRVLEIALAIKKSSEQRAVVEV